MNNHLKGGRKLNEVQLSDDLTTIETEIKSYQNIAGQSIFEIGRRLKHVKENDLAHGEFGKWLEKVNISKDYSAKYIKVFDEFDSSNFATLRNIGISALHEIATLPESERTIEHETSNGKTKTPDEMTVKELRELKKQLKQQKEDKAQLESQLEQAKRSESIAQKQLEDVEDKEPEIVEHYMEPEDYQDLKHKSEELEKHNKELKDKLKSLEAKPKEEPVVEIKKQEKYSDPRDQINADTQAVEPEVRKAMRRENLVNEFIATCEDLTELFEEIDDLEAFDKYISTLNYKALGQAKQKIEKVMKLGGYK